MADLLKCTQQNLVILAGLTKFTCKAFVKFSYLNISILYQVSIKVEKTKKQKKTWMSKMSRRGDSIYIFCGLGESD